MSTEYNPPSQQDWDDIILRHKSYSDVTQQDWDNFEIAFQSKTVEAGSVTDFSATVPDSEDKGIVSETPEVVTATTSVVRADEQGIATLERDITSVTSTVLLADIQTLALVSDVEPVTAFILDTEDFATTDLNGLVVQSEATPIDAVEQTTVPDLGSVTAGEASTVTSVNAFTDDGGVTQNGQVTTKTTDTFGTAEDESAVTSVAANVINSQGTTKLIELAEIQGSEAFPTTLDPDLFTSDNGAVDTTVTQSLSSAEIGIADDLSETTEATASFLVAANAVTDISPPTVIPTLTILASATAFTDDASKTASGIFTVVDDDEFTSARDPGSVTEEISNTFGRDTADVTAKADPVDVSSNVLVGNDTSIVGSETKPVDAVANGVLSTNTFSDDSGTVETEPVTVEAEEVGIAILEDVLTVRVGVLSTNSDIRLNLDGEVQSATATGLSSSTVPKTLDESEITEATATGVLQSFTFSEVSGSTTPSNSTPTVAVTDTKSTSLTEITSSIFTSIEGSTFTSSDDDSTPGDIDSEPIDGREKGITDDISATAVVSATIPNTNDIATTDLLGRFTEGVVETFRTGVTATATDASDPTESVVLPIISEGESLAIDIAEIQTEPLLQGYLGLIEAITTLDSEPIESVSTPINATESTSSNDESSVTESIAPTLNSTGTIYLRLPGSVSLATGNSKTPTVSSSVFSDFEVTTATGVVEQTAAYNRAIESPKPEEALAKPVVIGDPFEVGDLGDVIEIETGPISADTTSLASPKSSPTTAVTEIIDKPPHGTAIDRSEVASGVLSGLIETTTKQIVEYPFTITDTVTETITSATPQATDTGSLSVGEYDTFVAVTSTTAFEFAEVNGAIFDTLNLKGEFIATEPPTFPLRLVVDISFQTTEAEIHATTDDTGEIQQSTESTFGDETGIGIEEPELRILTFSTTDAAELGTAFESAKVQTSQYTTTAATLFSQTDIKGELSSITFFSKNGNESGFTDDKAGVTSLSAETETGDEYTESDDVADVDRAQAESIESEEFSFAIDEPSILTTGSVSVIEASSTYRAEGEVQSSEATPIVGDIEAIAIENLKPAQKHVPFVQSEVVESPITIDLRISGTVTESITTEIYSAKTETGVKGETTVGTVYTSSSSVFSLSVDNGSVHTPFRNPRTLPSSTEMFSDDEGSVTESSAESPTTLTVDFDEVEGSVTNAELTDAQTVSDTFSDDSGSVVVTRPLNTLRASDVATTDDVAEISPTLAETPASLDLAFTDVPGETQVGDLTDIYEANTIGLEDVDLAEASLSTLTVDSFTFSDDTGEPTTGVAEGVLVGDAQTVDAGSVTVSDEPTTLSGEEYTVGFGGYPQGGTATPIEAELVSRVNDFAEVESAVALAGRTSDFARTTATGTITESQIIETLSANEEGIATLTHVQTSPIVTILGTITVGISDEDSEIQQSITETFKADDSAFTDPSSDITEAIVTTLDANETGTTGGTEPAVEATASVLSAEEIGIGEEGTRTPTVLRTDISSTTLSAEDFAFSDDDSKVKQSTGTGLIQTYVYSDDTGDITNQIVTPLSGGDLAFTDDQSSVQSSSITVLFDGADNENAITFDPGKTVDSTTSVLAPNEHIRLNLGRPPGFIPGSLQEVQTQVTVNGSSTIGNDTHGTDTNYSDVGYGVTETIGEDGYATAYANTNVAPPAALYWQATGIADPAFTLTETRSDDTGEVVTGTVSPIAAPSGTFSDDNAETTDAEGLPQDGELHAFTDVPGSVETDQIFGMRALGTGVQSSVSGLVTLSITPVAKFNVRFEEEYTYSDDTGEVVDVEGSALDPINGPDDSRVDLLADIKQATASPLSANDEGFILQDNVVTRSFIDQPSADDLAYSDDSSSVTENGTEFVYRGDLATGIAEDKSQVEQIDSTILTPFANDPLGNNAIQIDNSEPTEVVSETVGNDVTGIQIDTSPATQSTTTFVLGEIFTKASAEILPVDVVASTPPADERSRKIDGGSISESKGTAVTGQINAIQIVNSVRSALAAPVEAESEPVTTDAGEVVLEEFDTYGITDAAFIEEGSVTEANVTTYVGIITTKVTSYPTITGSFVFTFSANETPRQFDDGSVQPASVDVLSEFEAIAIADISSVSASTETLNTSTFGLGIEEAEILLQQLIAPYTPGVPTEVGIAFESPEPVVSDTTPVTGDLFSFTDIDGQVESGEFVDVGSKTFLDLVLSGQAKPALAVPSSGNEIGITDIPGTSTEASPAIVPIETETIGLESPQATISETTTTETIVSGLRFNLEGEIQLSETESFGSSTGIAIDGTKQSVTASPVVADSVTFASDDSDTSTVSASGTTADADTTVIDSGAKTQIVSIVITDAITAQTFDISEEQLLIGQPVRADGGTLSDDVGDLIGGLGTPISANEKPKIAIKSEAGIGFFDPIVAATNGAILADSNPTNATVDTISASESASTQSGSLTNAQITVLETTENVKFAGGGSVTNAGTDSLSAAETIDLIDRSETERSVASPIASTEFITSTATAIPEEAVAEGIVDVETIKFDSGDVTRVLGTEALPPESVRITLKGEYNKDTELEASTNKVEIKGEYDTTEDLVARYDRGKLIKGSYTLNVITEGSISND